MTNENEPRIVKSLTGKLSIKYACPHCGEGLKNSIEECGTEDKCPNCHRAFVVPGKSIVDDLRRKEQEKREEAAQRKSEEEAAARDAAELKLRAKQREVADKKRRENESKVSPPPVAPYQQTGPLAVQLPGQKGVRSLPASTPVRRPVFTISEQVARVLLLVEFVIVKVWVSILFVSGGAGARFRDDNAYGATANSLESNSLILFSVLHTFLIISLFAYIRMRANTRIQQAILESLQSRFGG